MNTFDKYQLNNELIDFIGKSASMYHAAATIAGYMDAAGFIEIRECDKWNLENGGRYYVRRNNSSIIAFAVGDTEDRPYYKITASHSDSPGYAVKNIPELDGPGEYLRLNVEGYGGMISYSWLDRPLGIAGRVLVQTVKDGKLCAESRLINPDKDLLLIPSVCIHFNREVNSKASFDNQVDMCPLFSAGALKKGAFDKMIAECAGVNAEDILGKNLFLVNRQKGCIWGAEEEFVSSPKLDDLQAAFTSMKGFLAAVDECSALKGINVYACFDNEEVGSNTKQGAMSTFLADTLKRIGIAMGFDEEDYHRAVARSFMVSFDNAHALHPNHPEKADSCNTPLMNKGIVIKENANQKYCTDA